MKKILLLILSIFLISFISSLSICVDNDPPTFVNSTLTLQQSGTSVILTWFAATDIPACSGISYYQIFRSTDGVSFSPLTTVPGTQTQYTDSSLSYGTTYYYTIHVFDIVGNNEASEALYGFITLSSAPSGGGGGGSSGGEDYKFDNLLTCGEWSVCEDEIQYRECSSESEGLIINETRSCTPEFIPLGNENEYPEELQEESYGNFLTGAVVKTGEFIGSDAGGVSILIGLLLLGGFSIIVAVKKNKSS
ncbi:MAG: fibronectin type III domain-containing protein [Nanoarchaeota archaeon]|nr:fibronectin type III domain-containing protein [Nanoarchaeota archaeon]